MIIVVKDKLALVTVGAVWDACEKAAQANPFDGRTKEGRAFNRGVWAVDDAVTALVASEGVEVHE